MKENDKNQEQYSFSLLKSGKKIAFFTKLKPHLLEVEVSLITFSILGYFFKIYWLLSSSLILLSTIYFFLNFAKYEHHVNVQKIVSDFMVFLICVGRSACVAGIILFFMESSDPLIALYSGIILILLSIPFYLFYFFKRIRDEIFSLQQFIRNVIIISSAVLILVNLR